jgi:cytochrome c553
VTNRASCRRRLSCCLPLILAAAVGITVSGPAQAGQSPPTLDYSYFVTKIQPVFLKDRAPDEGAGQRCYNCHSRMVTRLRLLPLPAGAATWTEEQSRQLFQTVSGLVTPGDPMKSRLLLHPLAPEAGGDPTHTGGKFWKSPDNPEWQTIAAWVKGAAGEGGAAAMTVASAPALVLDYEFFKTQVQPVFLKKRPGVARCYACHGLGNGEGSASTAMHLEPMSPGATAWNEEQSRKNFAVIKEKVAVCDPNSSRLLLHPLRYEAGGDQGHMGGFQFQSPSDPDWQILATWVKGVPAPAAAAPAATATVAKAPPTLDFEFFKTQVQQVFLKKRPGVARCYACHGLANGEGSASTAMKLQVLSPGAAMWDEEQSRKNFDVVKEKVAAGDPGSSRLLIHPLRYEAGGDQGHMGGFQFQSPADPDWQVFARWVNGEKGAGK